VGSLLAASTVSALRLHDAATDSGRGVPARLGLTLAAALLFPALVPLGIVIHTADVSERFLLVLPVPALAVLLALWSLAGARGSAAVVPPVMIMLVGVVMFASELMVAVVFLLLWPVYALLVLAGAAFAEHARRARR
jgi:hypothetical protein